MDGLGADEMMFEIGVDDACSVHSFRSALNSPRTALILANREERDEAQQLICLADEPHQSAFFQLVASEKFGGVLVTHFGEFGFNLGADRKCSCVRSRRDFRYAV